jgi:hypothetical protein
VIGERIFVKGKSRKVPGESLERSSRCSYVGGKGEWRSRCLRLYSKTVQSTFAPRSKIFPSMEQKLESRKVLGEGRARAP